MDILLVEDNSLDRDLALHSLRQYGLANQIYVCSDGEQAVHFLLNVDGCSSQARIGMVLLDLHLPKVSGFEVLATIRACPEISKIPVIVLTSSDDMPDIEESRELGADHYMVKPIDFAKVVQVARVLGFRWALLPNEADAATDSTGPLLVT
jgi:CheY-like chemotaxis protein